jgi:hypothetical protein
VREPRPGTANLSTSTGRRHAELDGERLYLFPAFLAMAKNGDGIGKPLGECTTTRGWLALPPPGPIIHKLCSSRQALASRYPSAARVETVPALSRAIRSRFGVGWPAYLRGQPPDDIRFQSIEAGNAVQMQVLAKKSGPIAVPSSYRSILAPERIFTC